MRHLARDGRGVAGVEFALIVPTLLILLVGFLDVAYLARGHLRVQTTATQIGQIVSQCPAVAATDEAQLRNLAERTLGPFLKPGKRWALVVTAVGVDAANNPRRNWRFNSSNLDANNRDEFGSRGTGLPPGFGLSAGQVMFRTEVFADLDSMLFTKANSLLVEWIGLSKVNSITTVSSSALHMSRMADTTKLGTLSSTEACLS